MLTNIKKAIRNGDLTQVQQILKAQPENERELIESIDTEDLIELKKYESQPDWNFAGYGSTMLPNNERYRYEMDIEDKYAVRFERHPLIGTYDTCHAFIDEKRKTFGLPPLKLHFILENKHNMKLFGATPELDLFYSNLITRCGKR